MKDVVQLSRFSEKNMEVVASACYLFSAVKNLVVDPNQDSINEVEKMVSQLNTSIEDMQNALKTLCEEVVAVDKEAVEIDAKETEIGYKL